MRKETLVKSNFSQINNKRSYFPDGTLSLPFHHPNLKELNEFKKKWVSKLRNIFRTKKRSY